MLVIHINSDYGNTIYKNLSDRLFELGINQRVYKFVRPNNVPTCYFDDYVDVRLNYKNVDRYFYYKKHIKVAKDFLNYISEKQVTLIHAHTLFSNGYIANEAYKQRGIPYIVTVRGTDISVFFNYMKHLRNLAIQILLNAKRVVFISFAHKNTVFQKYIPARYKDVIDKKTMVIPNGIDEYYFMNKNSFKRVHSNRQITILTAAWINHNKNQVNVCRAIEILRSNGINIKYRIVGGVEKPNTYKRLVKKLKSYPFVEIVPRKNKMELLKEYREADIFVMVSHRETFGLSFIESLLQCTPIVYTRNQGVDGYFVEGVVGYPSLPNSPKDIAFKMNKIIDNYELLSKNSEKETDRFKWEEIALQYKKIYDSVESG